MGYFGNWIVNKTEEISPTTDTTIKKILLTSPLKNNKKIDSQNENNEKTIVIDFENPKQLNDKKVVVEKVNNDHITNKLPSPVMGLKVQKMSGETTYVYTDGACINNGKRNAKAGIGIFFSENDKRNTSARLDGKQSNNCAELEAIIQAIKLAKPELDNNNNVIIMTDSEYSIKCLTSYGRKLAQKNWETKNPIPNFHKVKFAYELFNKYSNLTVQHIRAHTGKNDKHSIGNDWADKLAVAGIKK